MRSRRRSNITSWRRPCTVPARPTEPVATTKDDQSPIRNLPLLFQILFWYLGVLGTLPGPRQSISLFGEVFLNNRGIILPAPVVGAGAGWVAAALVLGAIATIALRFWAKRRQDRTGHRFPLLGRVWCWSSGCRSFS